MADHTAAQREANYQQRVRVARYALEDIPILPIEWFVHDNNLLEHEIERNGESFRFTKSHFSNYKPTLVGYELWVPQITPTGGLDDTPIRLWVENPQVDTEVNRRATMDALRLLIRDRNLVSGRIDIDVYYA